MKKLFFFFFTICLGLLLFGCSNQKSISAKDKTEMKAVADVGSENVELTIAAAASLIDVTAEIAKEYEKIADNVKLHFTYGSSGSLQVQIEQGAPVDIFISAAQKQMDALDKGGLILSDTRANLLENKLMLITPKDSKINIKSFLDLTEEKVKKIAIGDPSSVPAGEYAKNVCTNLRIWDRVKEKCNMGTDVRQVLTWVETGDVDCGIVYKTDAAKTNKITIVCEAPADSAEKIIYPVSVLKNSKHASEATDFIDFLKTDKAIGLFEKYGFSMA
ncbi:MAG: molybdate ABC transporter substrate-binding protein [Clostridiales bacterium]|nr:molybdate ABC transporter substrate-binding protein [Clostridiales bacterium]